MKTILTTIATILFSGVVLGQLKVDTENKTITINTMIDSIDVIVDKGKFTLNIEGAKSYSIKKGTKYYDALSTDGAKSVAENLHGGISSLKLKFGSNTEYTITAITDDAVPKTRKYILRSQSDWSWVTTLGANAVIFTDRSKFVSKEENGVHYVAEIQDSKSMEMMPAIMFTLMNNHNNVSFGYTGGIGFNFEELSVFTGMSLGIGQNIILTGGMAIHKQSRPNTEYIIGQTIDASVSPENLNQQQYRFNPFVGISFRFDKNPFKAGSN